jgi:hypothetical protein
MFNSDFRNRFNKYKNDTEQLYIYEKSQRAEKRLIDAEPLFSSRGSQFDFINPIYYKSGRSSKGSGKLTLGGFGIEWVRPKYRTSVNYEIHFNEGQEALETQVIQLKRVVPNSTMNIGAHRYPDVFDISDEDGNSIFSGSLVTPRLTETTGYSVDHYGVQERNSQSGGNVTIEVGSSDRWQSRNNKSIGSIYYWKYRRFKTPKLIRP